MRYRKMSRLVFGLAAAALLAASPAEAHSGHTVTYTSSDKSTNAYPTTTSNFTVGSVEADVITIDFPPGMKFAHDDQHATEVSPNPNDEEQIGTGQAKASYWVFGFCSTSTQNLTTTWEEDMTGAPAGAVAHWVTRNALGFDTHRWIIEENDATDDYKMVSDIDNAWTCASSSQPSDAFISTTTDGTTSSGGHPFQNPSTSNCYTVNVSATEVGSSSTHTGSVGVEIGTGTC